MAKIQCNMISYTLKRTIDIDIILPTITIPEILFSKDGVHHEYPYKYPVVYLLHGFGNNHKQWGGYTNIELYAEENNIAIVMMATENKAYVNQGQDAFYDFINQELPEFITNTFPISNKPKDTFIAGLSMGGFGALWHGLQNSNKYKAIGAFSAAVKKLEVIPYDIHDLTKSMISKNMSFPNLYIACGDQDFLYEDNINYIKILKEGMIEVTWISESGYDHEWRFWDICIERFLHWIPRTDAYAKKKRKV